MPALALLSSALHTQLHTQAGRHCSLGSRLCIAWGRLEQSPMLLARSMLDIICGGLPSKMEHP